MNIRDAKTEIKNALLAYHRRDEEGHYKYPPVRQRPILLMGPPGIGKTAIMEQVAAECGVGLVAYTITHHTRQSAVGLPQIVSRIYGGKTVNVTEYTMSEIIASVYDCMERIGKQEGILFIDEINCVSETLAPTMLQFLQNKTFGTHRVPEGWMIVAAGNPREYNKSVREFDMVTLDRVRRIQVEPDCGVWMEYARERGTSGAILSYLSMKEDRFYQVESQFGEQRFVTARGWEDLSELIQGYEELGLEVTPSLVVQFLQQEDTARDFAAYYRIYRRYGEDYQIPELLWGRMSETARAVRISMGREASFEERFTVAELLLDTLDGKFREYEFRDRLLVRLHGALQALKKELLSENEESPEGADFCMEKMIGERKDSLKVKLQKELIDGRETRLEEQVIRMLEQYRLVLREEHVRDSKEGFARIRKLFGQELSRREELVGLIGQGLGRAFAFVRDCFGEDQEMLLLVSGLARNQRSADYIARHGCPDFLRYSELLTNVTPRESLRSACREALGEKREG